MPNNSTANTTVNGTRIGCYLNNKWDMLQGCAFPQYSDAFVGSDALFGLFLGSILLGTAWKSTGSVGPPAALVILLGSTLIPMLPASYTSMAWAILIIGLGGAFWAVTKRFVLNPSTGI